VYRYSPVTLTLGGWDSTGPRGGSGAKYQRCLTSEIIGINAVGGVKTSSRIDRLAIEVGPNIYQSKNADEEWTLEPEEAATDAKGQPVLFSRKGAAKAGRPAAINHGNILPVISDGAGGVTIDYAEQTIVLTLAGLRRLRFQTTCDGTQIPPAKRPEAQRAARAALAALALAGVVYARQHGFDLRSRSLLVPAEPLRFQVLDADGGPSKDFSLAPKEAASLLEDAVQAAGKHGLGWEQEPVVLTPAPKLVSLLRKSRQLSEESAEDAS
jgi:CRISPR-associated protein Csb1